MKKIIGHTGTILLTAAFAISLTSCSLSSGSKLKSYKNEVKKDVFDEKYSEVYDKYKKEVDDLYKEHEDKSFTFDFKKTGDESYKTTINKVTSKGKANVEESTSLKYDRKNCILEMKVTRNTTTQEDEEKETSSHKGAVTMFLSDTKVYTLDDYYKYYTEKEYRSEDLAKNYISYNAVNYMDTLDFSYVGSNYNSYNEKDFTYYVDGSVFTTVAETDFSSDSDYKGTSKTVVQYSFDGTNYTCVSKITNDYSILEDNKVKSTVKETVECSTVVKNSQKETSCEIHVLEEETLTKKEDVTKETESKIKYSAKTITKYSDVALKASLDGYYKK